ncbi:MAG: hypothetical protein L3J89_02735 [Gammaproteobacteria bacterium]|nr:hypothetical protein [Gammaproteobacteria bacterium]
MDEAALIESLGNDFAQDLVDSRITLFHNYLLELESNGCNIDMELYEEIFRRFHGAKGTGGIYGMYCITTVFHQLENLLTLIRSPDNGNHQQLFVKMHGELDLVEKMARAWLDGERDLRKLFHEGKASMHSNESALVLEPLRSVSNQIVAVLEDNGYEATLVSDGMEAMQSLLLRPYDLFITSEQNRFINGSELIGFIKITPRFANVKTVYLTTEQKSKWAVCAPDIIIKKDSSLLNALDCAIA